jgi:hypothetical protein
LCCYCWCCSGVPRRPLTAATMTAATVVAFTGVALRAAPFGSVAVASSLPLASSGCSVAVAHCHRCARARRWRRHGRAASSLGCSRPGRRVRSARGSRNGATAHCWLYHGQRRALSHCCHRRMQQAVHSRHARHLLPKPIPSPGRRRHRFPPPVHLPLRCPHLPRLLPRARCHVPSS